MQCGLDRPAHVRIASLAIALALTGCGASLFRVDTREPVSFVVGPLPSTWREVEAKSDVAFRSNEGGTIYANAECGEELDAPLDVLTNHLLFGVDSEREERREMTLAGRKALRTTVEGQLDGVPIRMETVVLMKDGCTYDLVLVAGPDEFAEHQAAFDRFVSGFDTLSTEEGLACSTVPC